MDELTKELIAIHNDAERAQLTIAQAQTALARADYAKSMALLRALKAGRVPLDHVFLDGDRWQVVEVKQVPRAVPEG